jgi:putative ABC transport system permease protein
MGTLARDIRYAIRTLLRAPGFTLVVVATLGIGIGANTAVFSVVDTVLLDRLPYPDPHRLVAVSGDARAREGGPRAGLDPAAFPELRDEPGLFEATAAWRRWEPTLTGVDDPEVLSAAEVSDGMLSRVLRVRPELGRDFLRADGVEGAVRVVLLSHRTWRERFEADPNVVGRSLSLSDVPYTVIGVMPEGFRPPFAPDASVWRALGSAPGGDCAGDCAELSVLARLAPGVALEQARAHAATLFVRMAERLPDADGWAGLAVVGLREEMVRASARPLWLLWGAVGFALLLACANVANLLLARGLGRAREVAVRLALGAEPGRILAQVLAESLVLAAVGGVVGLGIAAWGTDALLALAPAGTVPRLDGVGMSVTVLGFTASLAAGTGVAFGLVPAWVVARRGVPVGLRAPERRVGRPSRWSVTAAVQVALSLVLLVGAGLCVRSFRELDAVDLGVRAEGVLALDVVLPPSRYPDDAARRAFSQALLRRISGLPGVRSAGAAQSLPLDGDDEEADLLVEGTRAATDGSPTVQVRPVTEGYFGTVGLGVLAGRPFARSDGASAPRVAVVNETLARRYFPQGGAVGRRIAVDDAGVPAWRTIVGVVRDVRHHGIREPARPAVYLPFAQAPPGAMSLVVRADGDPLDVAPEVREAVSGLDPSLAAARVRPLRDLVDRALAPDRFVAAILASFALLVLLLSGIGVYGVVSQAVTRRSREMGIRLAVGAEARDLVRVVIRGGLAVAGVGLGLGTVASVAVGPVLARFLYRVSPTDPLTMAVAAAVLACVAAMAAWVPARRAGRSDPVGVLRRD